jgi:hypothetical protein
MAIEFPWDLLIAYCALTACIAAQLEFIRRGELLARLGWHRSTHETARVLSSVAALTMFATLAHYMFAAAWYWSPILFVAGVLLSGFVLRLAVLFVGESIAIAAAFFVWPLFAIWANVVIARLP